MIIYFGNFRNQSRNKPTLLSIHSFVLLRGEHGKILGRQEMGEDPLELGSSPTIDRGTIGRIAQSPLLCLVVPSSFS